MRRDGRGVLAGLLVVMVAIVGAVAATPNTFFATTSDSSGGLIYSCNQSVFNYACFYPADTSNFTGMNNPYVLQTAGNGSTTAQGTLLNNDVYNHADSNCTGWSQTISANSAQQWKAVANYGTNGANKVCSYPAAGVWGYSGVLDDYTTLSSTYNLAMPIDPGVVQAWATTDDFLTGPQASPSSQDFYFDYAYEVQIHLDSSLDGTNNLCPATWGNNGGGTAQSNFGVVATGIVISGVTWYLCDGQYAHNADGSCQTGLPAAAGGPFCGEMVFVGGTRTAPTPATPTVSGTLNLKAFFQYLETNNAPSGSGCSPACPYMQAGSSLYELSSGYEIVTTGGTSQTFTHSGWTVSATGQPTPPSTTPTYTSSTTGTAGSFQCTIHWTNDTNATYGYDGYAYYSSGGPAGAPLHLAAGTTSDTFTGTASGQTANLELASVNTGGPGQWWAGQYQTCVTG